LYSDLSPLEQAGVVLLMLTKQELLEQAAYILEQEGWLIGRAARDTGSTRLKQFYERYAAWQAEVRALREAQPGEWAAPPDNS
jgi:hypothetical protein